MPGVKKIFLRGGIMGKINFEEIKKEVKKKVSEITEVPEEKLKEDAKFVEDLGVDSMMALEIVASIEKKYKVTIPETEIPKMGSLKDIYALLEKVMK
jgi:acyl carrier protein